MSGENVIAVVITRDRPLLLERCLQGIAKQCARVGATIVIDDAGAHDAHHVTRRHPGTQLIRLHVNRGPAAAYGIGMRAALAAGATHLWLMDDDGVAGDADCLGTLLAALRGGDVAIAAPLVRAVADPARLAFPLRLRARTRFRADDLDGARIIPGKVHFFNGTLLRAELVRRIGFPDPRLFMRGDEVEYGLRARRAGAGIVTVTDAVFLHPDSAGEIHPILGGLFYAVVPASPLKRHHQFRNRGWIFARHNMWLWLAADHVRYFCHYAGRRDPAGYAAWLALTWSGVFGLPGTPRPARVTLPRPAAL